MITLSTFQLLIKHHILIGATVNSVKSSNSQFISLQRRRKDVSFSNEFHHHGTRSARETKVAVISKFVHTLRSPQNRYRENHVLILIRVRADDGKGRDQTRSIVIIIIVVVVVVVIVVVVVVVDVKTMANRGG